MMMMNVLQQPIAAFYDRLIFVTTEYGNASCTDES